MTERHLIVQVVLVVALLVFFAVATAAAVAAGEPATAETTTTSSSSSTIRRSLYEQSDLWRISEPNFNFNKDTSQFELNFDFSDFIQDKFASVSIYDGYGCKDGSNDITEKITRETRNFGHLPFVLGLIESFQ